MDVLLLTTKPFQNALNRFLTFNFLFYHAFDFSFFCYLDTAQHNALSNLIRGVMKSEF